MKYNTTFAQKLPVIEVTSLHDDWLHEEMSKEELLSTTSVNADDNMGVTDNGEAIKAKVRTHKY